MGKIPLNLFSGGFGGNFLDEILRYHPATLEQGDSWTVAGKMTEAKFYQAATPLADISQFDDICSQVPLT